jgi:hypothetical protein
MLNTGSQLLIATSLAIICLFGSLPASALRLDANVLGVFTDSTLATSVAGVTIDPDGDAATAPLTAGHMILIGIEVSNPAAETIQAIFASLVVQGDQIAGSLGARLPPTMLKGPGPFDQSLVNVNSGSVKNSQPGGFGSPGDVWVQAPAYALQTGANGTGPDAIQILFVVAEGLAIGDFVTFEMGMTAGDAIAGPAGSISTTFSSTVIQVIPQPGTALLIGLGLIGLGARQRAN